MSKAWIYCRVSTKEQAIDGTSLTYQFNECLEYVKAQGLTLGRETNYNNPGVFADPGVGAWKNAIFDRPGFQALMKAAKRGDKIVIHSLDRAFRSVMNFSNSWEVFKSLGIELVFVRDSIDMSTATGRLFAHIAASFAQFKSDLISQRMKESYSIRKRSNDKPVKKAKQVPNPGIQGTSKIITELKKEQKKGRVFGYARVSTGEQCTLNQEIIVGRYMDRMVESGYEDSDIYVDEGVSAFTTDWRDRYAGNLLWSELKKGDCVVVLRIDRVFRSIHDMSVTIKDMISRGVDLVTTCGLDTRTTSGRQAIELMAMMAEWESRDISWRVKLGMSQKSALFGKWGNGPLPSYMKKQFINDEEWVAVPDQRVIDDFIDIKAMHESGMTAAQISDCMESIEASRSFRRTLPRTPFDKGLYLRRMEMRSAPTIERWAMDDWFRDNKPIHTGEYVRRWEYQRVVRAIQSMNEVMEISGRRPVSQSCLEQTPVV